VGPFKYPLSRFLSSQDGEPSEHSGGGGDFVAGKAHEALHTEDPFLQGIAMLASSKSTCLATQSQADERLATVSLPIRSSVVALWVSLSLSLSLYWQDAEPFEQDLHVAGGADFVASTAVVASHSVDRFCTQPTRRATLSPTLRAGLGCQFLDLDSVEVPTEVTEAARLLDLGGELSVFRVEAFNMSGQQTWQLWFRFSTSLEEVGPQSIAYHGTSLACLRQIREYGQLKPGSRQEARRGNDDVVFSAKTFDRALTYSGPCRTYSGAVQFVAEVVPRNSDRTPGWKATNNVAYVQSPIATLKAVWVRQWLYDTKAELGRRQIFASSQHHYDFDPPESVEVRSGPAEQHPGHATVDASRTEPEDRFLLSSTHARLATLSLAGVCHVADLDILTH